jgi:hypothetical protein
VSSQNLIIIISGEQAYFFFLLLLTFTNAHHKVLVRHGQPGAVHSGRGSSGPARLDRVRQPLGRHHSPSSWQPFAPLAQQTANARPALGSQGGEDFIEQSESDTLAQWHAVSRAEPRGARDTSGRVLRHVRHAQRSADAQASEREEPDRTGRDRGREWAGARTLHGPVAVRRAHSHGAEHQPAVHVSLGERDHPPAEHVPGGVRRGQVHLQQLYEGGRTPAGAQELRLRAGHEARAVPVPNGRVRRRRRVPVAGARRRGQRRVCVSHAVRGAAESHGRSMIFNLSNVFLFFLFIF